MRIDAHTPAVPPLPPSCIQPLVEATLPCVLSDCRVTRALRVLSLHWRRDAFWRPGLGDSVFPELGHRKLRFHRTL